MECLLERSDHVTYDRRCAAPNRPFESAHDHAAAAWLDSGVQDLPPLIGAAGFTNIDASATSFPMLGFVRGQIVKK
jgi:hypothetical protein